MSPEHIAQVWAEVEVKVLDRLADLRGRRTLQRIEALRFFVVGCALPRWNGQSGDFHLGALEVLRTLVHRAGRLVTSAAILGEVDAEAYEWAKSVGLTPSVIDETTTVDAEFQPSTTEIPP